MPVVFVSWLKVYWPRCLLGVAILVHLVMMGSLFWGYFDAAIYGSHVIPKGADFFSIYEAGLRAIENQPLYYGGFGEAAEAPYSLAYRYVPVFAYLFTPMTLLSPWKAYWAWVAFTELLLVLNAYVSWRIAGRGSWGIVAASMWLLFTPFYLEQYMGQFSFLMATALFWTGIGLVQGRERIAGPPWLLSLITKSNSAVLAPLFIRLGWWRSLAGAGVLLVINIPYFVWRLDEFELFHRMNLTGFLTESTTSRFTVFHPADQSGLALLRNGVMALDSAATNFPPVFAVGLTLAVVGYSLEATFFSRKPDPLALFALWVSAFFLFYGVWEYHYVMFLPVLVLLVAYRPEIRPLALAVFVFVALPTPYWLLNNIWNTGPVPEGLGLVRVQEAWPLWGVILVHAAKPLPVAVLWGYLAVSLLRQGVALPQLPALRVMGQRFGSPRDPG